MCETKKKEKRKKIRYEPPKIVDLSLKQAQGQVADPTGTCIAGGNWGGVWCEPGNVASLSCNTGNDFGIAPICFAGASPRPPG